MDCYQEAIQRFQALLDRARASELREPTAMVLATADSDGRPSARTVLVKEVIEHGVVFYTNMESRKGTQLAANARAALCAYWEPLEEQVQIEGAVVHVPDAEADAYWKTRPRQSQIGAWASLQSRPLPHRQALVARAVVYGVRFAGQPVPRPPHWIGYRLLPERVEFWRRRPFRMHERTLYEQRGETWTVTHLFP